MLIGLLVLGGAIGAPARYLVDGVVQSRARGVFPWGTFVINISGSFVLGVVTGAALYHGLGPLPKTAIGTGFCGAYTTFSTFSYETVRLLEEGSVATASCNAIASVVIGLAAAAGGIALLAAL
ncbi:MAG TPA: fluoride efflux transporter CrcB [Acidimicrobiia bacterium]|jgi:CrcB protein|nr:fluoride efflux transporter CrcB [Acidimicrobiia bacterium]